MSLSRFIARQPTWSITLGGAGLVLWVGWLDYITGWELSLFVLYALPILLVVWYGNLASALGLAALCGGVWWLANEGQNPYRTGWGFWLASASRLSYFFFVAIGGAALKTKQGAIEARIHALERTRELEQEIVQVSEHEQRRIGQDLHDGLCQELASIGFAASMLKEDLKSNSPTSAIAAVEEIETLLKDAVVTTRNLARGIFPVQMEAIGLAVALEELARTVRRLHRVNVSLEARGENMIEDPERNMHLYRIAQEAVGNAIKHGNARNIGIVLREEQGAAELRISDDGTGIQDGPGSSGMGLKTMKYRAHLIGAELSLDKSASGGVIVSVTRNNPNTSQAKRAS